MRVMVVILTLVASQPVVANFECYGADGATYHFRTKGDGKVEIQLEYPDFIEAAEECQWAELKLYRSVAHCKKSNSKFVIHEPGGSYIEPLKVERHYYHVNLSCDD